MDRLASKILVTGVCNQTKVELCDIRLTSTIGINVNASWTYNASLYYRFPNTSTFTGPLSISLLSSAGTILASQSFNISGTSTNWTQLNATLTPISSGPDTNNTFAVTVDGTAASGETINFAMLSLFPPTYKGRVNGMRMDIAEVSGWKPFSSAAHYDTDASGPRAFILPSTGW